MSQNGLLLLPDSLKTIPEKRFGIDSSYFGCGGAYGPALRNMCRETPRPAGVECQGGLHNEFVFLHLQLAFSTSRFSMAELCMEHEMIICFPLPRAEMKSNYTYLCRWALSNCRIGLPILRFRLLILCSRDSLAICCKRLRTQFMPRVKRYRSPSLLDHSEYCCSYCHARVTLMQRH